MKAGLVAPVLLAAPAAAQEGKPLDAEARAACETAGGYAGHGFGQKEQRNLPAADAGKACATNADCESLCLVLTAACDEWKPPFGGRAVLVGKGQNVAICVD